MVDPSWERIGVTGNHPIWSQDRHDYVAAMDLRLGERLKNLSGDTVWVQQKLPRPGPTPVYNLEVQDEHVYYVGAHGVLAHNTDIQCFRDSSGRLVDQISGPGQRLAGQIDEVARRRALGIDPASGRYRVLEEQAALRLEQRVGRLRRDPSGTGDWLDTAGLSYDAVGPVPVRHIDTGAFINQINHHLNNKQGLDFVVVDLTEFNSSQRHEVFNHLRTLDHSQLGRIRIQRRR